MEITENQEFKDISKTGKDRKWKERKLQNIEYAKRLEILGYKAFANAYQCAEVLRNSKGVRRAITTAPGMVLQVEVMPYLQLEKKYEIWGTTRANH